MSEVLTIDRSSVIPGIDPGSLVIQRSACSVLVSDEQIMELTRDFIGFCIGDATAILRGQQNREAQPREKDYILFTPKHRERIKTNSRSYRKPQLGQSWGYMDISVDLQVNLNIEIHGPASADNATLIYGLFRDTVASDFFSASGLPVQPLYANEPEQAPFINGESQYEDTWSFVVLFEVEEIISIPQKFFSAFGLNVTMNGQI